MKIVIMTLVLAFIPGSAVFAQTAPSGKTLAATLEVYVFPTGGQDAARQSKDEGECYNWAVNNVGSDPFELSKKSAQQQQDTEQSKQAAAKSGQGSGARGAFKGAALGALIGEIADDDAGKGAAYGAGVGLLAGRRGGRVASAQAVDQAAHQGQAQQQATAAQVDNFKKAFSVCLEAKEYMVKY